MNRNLLLLAVLLLLITACERMTLPYGGAKAPEGAPKYDSQESDTPTR